MYPPPATRPGGRSRHGRLLAFLATPVLALPLLAAVPAAGESQTPSAAGDTAGAVDTADTVETDGGGAQPGAPAGLEVPDEPVAVTLITGDKVLYGGEGSTEGQPGLDFEPAPRESGVPVSFTYEWDMDDFYVFPSDTVALIGEGTVDKELFNVTGLIEQGLDDEASGGAGVPVLATFTEDLDTAAEVTDAADELPAVEDEVTAAPKANAAGVKVDRGKADQFWNAVAADRSNRGGNKDKNTDSGGSDAAPSLGAGVAELRLDAVFEISLDVSVPQIGAPEAWEAGYTGEGVTVAVLDTGVDEFHPDLAGQVVQAENFTDEPDASDMHGHGTHVASTIAGTGAASNGQYVGVAPDADLISGKVCDAAGDCQESHIMAAMEWATDAGADVVNMSLGGGPTDGTDPVSQLVNTLTAESGTLFVIAAGNSGAPHFGNEQVGSPAAADAALAVGAVTKADQMAYFSSRGPRVGDGAVKPEITAPGHSIVAARAEGTSIGKAVGEDYTTISGTSMATPHVAGAAALLAQAEPDLTGLELKDVLASTAADGGYRWFQQGTGRTDVPAAINAEVYASAAANLGRLTTGQTAQGDIAYTNTGDADVTLDLAIAVTDMDGNPVEGVALSTDTLTVPAGGTATATVTAEADRISEGVYGGAVTATTEGISLRTGVGFSRLHKVTVNVLDSNGDRIGTAYAPDYSMHLTQDSYDWDNPAGRLSNSGHTQGGVATYYLPTGIYTAVTAPKELNEDGTVARKNFLVEQEFSVDGDMELTMDAREAVLAEQPGVPDEVEVRGREMHLAHEYRDDPEEQTYGTGEGWLWDVGALKPSFYVSPTPPSEIAFTSLWDSWVLADPQPQYAIPHEVVEGGCEDGIARYCYSETPDYIYHLTMLHDDGIPEDLGRELTRKDLVEIPAHFHAENPETLIKHLGVATPHYYGLFFFTPVHFEPGEVTEYYLPDSDLNWDRANGWTLNQDRWEQYQFGLYTYEVFGDDLAGTRRDVEDWFQAPLTVGNAIEFDESFREYFQQYGYGFTPVAFPNRGGVDGNTFDGAYVPMDGDGHWTPFTQFGSARMWNLDTGDEIDSIGQFQDFELAPEMARYRLEVSDTYQRGLGDRFADETGAPLFQTKPTATTVWEFESRPSDASVPGGYVCPDRGERCQIQPVINLSYDLDLDTYNRAPAGRAHKFTITARHHTYAIDRAGVTDLSVEASFDGGETWQEVTVTPGKGKHAEDEFIVTVKHPKLGDTTGFVSLRVTAEDASGGTVEQTLQRAYILE